MTWFEPAELLHDIAPELVGVLELEPGPAGGLELHLLRTPAGLLALWLHERGGVLGAVRAASA